jgi:hypothetical protein
MNIYQIATSAGFIAKNGSLATARTIMGTTGQIDVANGDGSGGNPVLSIDSKLTGYKLITSTTLSSTASPVVFNSASIVNYNNLLFTFNAVIPGTPPQPIFMEVSTDGGSTWATGGEIYFVYDVAPGTQWSVTPPLQIAASYATQSGWIKMSNPNLTLLRDFQYMFGAIASMTGNTGGGFINSTTQINAVRFSYSAGNFSSGTIALYGF